MSYKCPLAYSVLYTYIPQYFFDIVKVTYPWYKCDFEQKVTGTNNRVVILADTKETKKGFLEIRGNIKHYFTDIMDESGVGNYNLPFK